MTSIITMKDPAYAGAHIEADFSAESFFPEPRNMWIQENNKPCQRSTTDLFSGKLIIVFTIPNISTKVSDTQLKEFTMYTQEWAKKIDISKVICLARDTIENMTHWRDEVSPGSTIEMVSDVDSHLSSKYARSGVMLENGKMVYKATEQQDDHYGFSSAFEIFSVVKHRVDRNLLKNVGEERKEREKEKENKEVSWLNFCEIM